MPAVRSAALADFGVDGGKEGAERIGESLDVPAGQEGCRLAGAAHERRVADEDLVRLLAMADPELVWLLGVPRHGPGRAVDLVLERVLATSGELADGHRAAGAVLEAKQDHRGVLGADVARDRLGVRSVEKVSTGPVGCWRVGMNVARSAMTSVMRRPVVKAIRSSQCEPMSPTARSAPPSCGSRRQFQSVSSRSQSWK